MKIGTYSNFIYIFRRKNQVFWKQTIVPSIILMLDTYSNFKNNSVIIVFLAILLVLMLIPVAKALVRNLLLYLKYRQAYLAGDHAEMVSHYYRKAVKHLSLKYIIKTSGMVDDTFDALENMLTKNNEASARIAGFLTLNGTDLGSLRLLTLSCFYSDKKLGRPDADLLIKFFKHIAHCRIH